MTVGGRLAGILAGGGVCVTGEIVPPRSAGASGVSAHARGLVGYVDAVNVTDNPVASAHMSPLAGVRFVAETGIEPTVQLTCRDRNRLALTGDLLGAWALGARNLLCLSGDPLTAGDDPEATAVHDLNVTDVIGLARRMRDEGTTSTGAELAEPPRYYIGAADVPLSDPYDPIRLETKLDAGADFVMTQIVYDVDALAAWAETMRARGLFERTKVIIGLVPLRSAKAARYMDEHLFGVAVPPSIVSALEAAGEDAPNVGRDLTIGIVKEMLAIEGISGVHLMSMGHDEIVRDVVEGAGLFPRPSR